MPSRVSLFKRCFDASAAVALLVLVAPLLIVSAILIVVFSPGPVIFAQEREGKGERPFTLYKLRTMRVDARARLDAHLAADADNRREWEQYRRLREDPRLIPRIGVALRRSSIDELPQLWNVIRGDMSLVGPRPLELEVAARVPPATRARRASIRPGMTGLWQVSGRSETDIAQMVALDDEYLRDWAIEKDLAILVRTPLAVLSRRGAY